MTYFKVDHRGQRRENARRELGRIDEELSVNKKHSTDVEVQRAKMIDKLSHDWNVSVQLYLTYTDRQTDRQQTVS